MKWQVAGAALCLVYYAIIWLLFLAGIITRDVWIAAPTAFLILLEHLADER